MQIDFNAIGSIASIIAFLGSIHQASKAKSAAQEAKEASRNTRKNIYKNEKARKLGELQEKVKILIQVFKKYSKGTLPALLQGEDHLEDCRSISNFLITFSENKYLFSQWGNNIEFEKNVNSILTIFSQESLSPDDIINNGYSLLVELSSFNGAIEKLLQENKYRL